MPFKILIAEAPAMLPRLKATLAPHALHAAHDIAHAKKVLDEGSYDLVILGAHIENGAMLEVLRHTVAHELCRNTPIICVRTTELWSPMPGLVSTVRALGADALIDFARYPSEEAAHAGLAGLVNDFLRCGTHETGDQVQQSLDGAMEHFKADFGNVQVYNASDRSLRIVAQRNCPAEFMAYFDRVDDGKAACGAAMKKRQRVIVGDVQTDPVFGDSPARQILLDSGIHALHSTPVFSRPANLRGMLSLHYRSAQRPSEAQFAFADILGRRMASSLADMKM